MKINCKILIWIVITILISTEHVMANAINFTVSPIVYELNGDPGTNITKTAKIRNNSNIPITLNTSASDFEATWNTGQPKFVRRSELIYQSQELASWINIEESTITLAPWEEKSTNFTINIPENATPGWHYWAVFFKNNNSNISNEWSIWINVDYGVLIILKVNGEIVVNGEVTDVTINVWWWAWSWAPSKPTLKLKDKIKDFITSEFFSPQVDIKKIINEDTNISIKLDFENTGNTHIKPEGKIEITDEDGNQFKKIGRKSIVNEAGAIIWEEVVDYIPLNDQWGNVLPNTEREFTTEWKWFPYEGFNENGEKITKYKDLGEYYTDKNMRNRNFLMFWEEERQREAQKKLTANIKLSYEWADGSDIEYTSAKDFYVAFTERYIWYNWKVVIPWIFIFTILFFWFLIAWKRRKKKEERLEAKIREKIQGELVWKTKKVHTEMKIVKKRWRPKKDS